MIPRYIHFDESQKKIKKEGRRSKMRKFLLVWLLAAASTVIGIVQVDKFAESHAATAIQIHGFVYDIYGNLQPGAYVFCANDDTLIWIVPLDGDYYFSGLPTPHMYYVWAEKYVKIDKVIDTCRSAVHEIFLETPDDFVEQDLVVCIASEPEEPEDEDENE